MNKQLLEHYIEAYGTDIYSFCIRLTQNRELAEELYQDTFLAMCEKEDWKEEGNVKSYLLGITIKLWQNRKRKFAWRKRIAAEIPLSKELDLTTLAKLMARQPAEKKRLSELHDSLKPVMQQLVNVNQRNKELIENSLEMIEFNMNFIQSTRMSPGSNNYNRNASSSYGIDMGPGAFDAKQ